MNAARSAALLAGAARYADGPVASRDVLARPENPLGRSAAAFHAVRFASRMRALLPQWRDADGRVFDSRRTTLAALAVAIGVFSLAPQATAYAAGEAGHLYLERTGGISQALTLEQVEELAESGFTGNEYTGGRWAGELTRERVGPAPRPSMGMLPGVSGVNAGDLSEMLQAVKNLGERAKDIATEEALQRVVTQDGGDLHPAAARQVEVSQVPPRRDVRMLRGGGDVDGSHVPRR